MSENHFRVVYEGPAVDDGEMEVGQLAPSLLALGKLIETLDALGSGEQGRVRVLVRADPRPGSFDIGLALDFVHSVKSWLISPDGQATSTALSLLGVSGGGGLIWLVKKLKGRKPKTKVVLEDGRVRIETSDTEILIVPSAVARAAEDPAVRQHLERFTEPLRAEGVESIRFNGEDGSKEAITAQDAEYFIASAGKEPTSQDTFKATYQIKRLYFEEGKKWRLSNGSQSILAQIEDADFWKRVQAAEISFSADDYLVCMVRMDQWFSEAGLKTEYAVAKVLEHIPSARQARFDGT